MTNQQNIIGIIGAMEIEIEHIVSNMKNIDTQDIFGLTFYHGEFANKNVVVCRSGIGKVNAARTTQIMLDNFKPTHIINSGVAGAISSKLSIYDIVISDELVQHDVNVSFFGHPLGVIKSSGVGYFAACKGIIDIAKDCITSTAFDNKNISLHIGRIATGDQFIATTEQKDIIAQNFNALCAEMEGAAIAQVCTMADIPFIVIRVISDKANGSASVDFTEFAEVAARLSSEVVFGIIRGL